MTGPEIVSPAEWEEARQAMLVKEKEHTRARDALASQRRRMPMTLVKKERKGDSPEREAEHHTPKRDMFERAVHSSPGGQRHSNFKGDRS